jgi:biotin operon repressor
MFAYNVEYADSNSDLWLAGGLITSEVELTEAALDNRIKQIKGNMTGLKVRISKGF